MVNKFWMAGKDENLAGFCQGGDEQAVCLLCWGSKFTRESSKITGRGFILSIRLNLTEERAVPVAGSNGGGQGIFRTCLPNGKIGG